MIFSSHPTLSSYLCRYPSPVEAGPSEIVRLYAPYLRCRAGKRVWLSYIQLAQPLIAAFVTITIILPLIFKKKGYPLSASWDFIYMQLLRSRHSREGGCVAIPFRHCERPEGARQSPCFQWLMRLLQSFHSLAMTL